MKTLAIIGIIAALSSCRSTQDRALLDALRTGQPYNLPTLSDDAGEPDLAKDAQLLDILTSGKPSNLPTLE